MIHNRAKQQKLAAEGCKGKTRPRYETFSDILPDVYHLYIYTSMNVKEVGIPFLLKKIV